MAEYEGEPAGAAEDALLAAIMDEPLPGEARDDPGLVAEHRAAVADVAVLREQLAVIGEALAGRAEPAPVRRSARRTRRPGRAPGGRARRPLATALGAVAATAAVGLVAGLGLLVVQGGAGAGDTAKSDSAQADSKGGGDASAYSPEMHIACSRVLVEGTVVSITPREDGDVRVVLKVKHYYRPQESVRDRPTITVTLDGAAREDLEPGVHTLVRVPVSPRGRQDWEVGWGVGDARKGILEALPGAEGLTCRGPEQGGD